LLPHALLRTSAHLEGERIVPHYLTPKDEPWLAALIHEYRRFAGKKSSELQEQLREARSSQRAKAKLRVASVVLDALCLARPPAAVPAKEARAALFRAAAASHASRVAVLNTVAASFAVTPVELESALFADLRGERRVSELPAHVSPSRLAANANFAIVSSLIRRAVQVRVVARGEVRALIRQARIAGLICGVSRSAYAADGVALDLSGPFALFQHSDRYGRALASLIPRLASCAEFELNASCALGHDGQLGSLALRSGDPIEPSSDLPLPRRALDQRFERDFLRAAVGWDLLREPLAIASGDRLIFPDFELVPRHDPTRSWLLEIIGFWTPEYLHEKLKRLSEAGCERFLLCVDLDRHCGPVDLPQDPRLLRYTTRIDARAVLARIVAAPLSGSF